MIAFRVFELMNDFSILGLGFGQFLVLAAGALVFGVGPPAR